MLDLVKELFKVRRYKPNQGRLVRQLTMLGVWAIFLSAAYKFFEMPFLDIPLLTVFSHLWVRGVAAAIIGLFGVWFGFRLVNWPIFADFLVAVESEMVKVSWPGKAELYSSTVVVLVMFLALSAMIFAFDLFWLKIFTWIKVL